MSNKVEDDMIVRLDAKRRQDRVREALDRAYAALTPREREEAKRRGEQVAEGLERRVRR